LSEQWSDISASAPARLANEAILNIGQSHIIRPAIGEGDGRVAAPIVSAMDRDAAHARLAHLAEGDFLLAGPMEFREARVDQPKAKGK
jgi:hypothetical protein